MNRPTSVTDIHGRRYELTELLGRGGQGAVYAVKGGRLAVKVMASRGLGHQERMRNQLSHVRRLPLDKLALAKPLELLRPPHSGYVMERFTGMVPIGLLLAPPRGEKSITEWYQRTGGLRRRLLVLGRVAYLLAQIHGKGLAYSDPAPGNIFVSEDMDFTEVGFIDTDNLRYESGPGADSRIYTPGYGAPELVSGKAGISTLTDAYALAVIAFRVLSLVHPFIGDRVNEGEPELEEEAYAGKLPWIEDVGDGSNRTTLGVPRGWVLSKLLREGFAQAFGEGRSEPMARLGAAEWAERFFTAADATIACPNVQCGGSYYCNETQCMWCGTERPAFVEARIYLSSPGDASNHHEKGIGRTILPESQSITITRRLAFWQMGQGAEEPVVEINLRNNRVRLRSLDGKRYRLVSASGTRQTTISEQAQVISLTPGQKSWSLHFGDQDQLHRYVRFHYQPGARQ